MMPLVRVVTAPQILLMGLLLALPVASGGCATGCPTAMLEGTLEARNGELVIAQQGARAPERIEWPDGYRVEDRDGILSVVDLIGALKAREGDFVSLGGGKVRSGTFKVCGRFETEPLQEAN